MQGSSLHPSSSALGTTLGDDLKDARPKMNRLISESLLKREESQLPNDAGYASADQSDEKVIGNTLMNLEKFDSATFKKQFSSSRSEGKHESGPMNHPFCMEVADN
eukprot:CAMPEP_0170462698 /NCGR_PEP_ID=MMETSP0123-20130129/8104_1 /TAXON_ID=182087 /ORGANISM="Favella ehrenbergii, Strain Fehren 1" /LENGTH=105 /DNA_ID=CAMNT_0010727979 /DNA_START=104 /DNA_END=421 /DNA_ORIENTATION=-